MSNINTKATTIINAVRMEREEAHRKEDMAWLGYLAREQEVSLIQIDSSMYADAQAELERWTGASPMLLQREEKMELTDQQEDAVRKLFNMAKASRNEQEKAMLEDNRRTVLEANEEEAEELDRLIAEQQEDMDEDENWQRLLRKSQAERSYEMVEWFKVNAPMAKPETLMKWSKLVNGRRISPAFKEDRLSYCHWVASKIVIEYWMSRKAYGKVKAKAAVEYAKRRAEWDENKLQERYDAHLMDTISDMDRMDPDGSTMGRCGIPASRMAEYIDISRDKDEDLLKGFLLFREKEGLQLPQGKEAKSYANVLIALSRCNGNKTAAAKLLGVARSTFNGWVKQAQKQLEAMATPVAESVIQGLIHGRHA